MSKLGDSLAMVARCPRKHTKNLFIFVSPKLASKFSNILTNQLKRKYEKQPSILTNQSPWFA